MIRDDLEGKTDNHCFDWETGDEAATNAVFASADVVVSEDIVYPRVHPAPMETCGCVADYDRVNGQADALGDLPGAARPPDRLRPRVGAARAQDPGHLPRHRRRFRQQGAHLSRLRVRDRRHRSC